jgi:large subunit ribosomal protein L35
MPKKKTCKSAAKRFRLTGGGKVKYAKPFGKHLLGHKSSRRKRRIGKAGVLSEVEARRIRGLLSS